jgi:two-component system LytT family response regulator
MHGRRSAPREQIFLRDGERCWIVRTADIELLESEGNYTRIFFHDEHPLIAGSLAAFEQRMDAGSFFRASRKHVINLNFVQATEWEVSGNLLVKLRCGQQVSLSRRQSTHLKEILSL